MESDCLEVVEACRSRDSQWEIVSIVEDITLLHSRFAHYAVVWCPRECNAVANHITSLSLVGNLPPGWSVRIPSSFDRILDVDSNSISM